ncbi:MAG: 3'-5' exonuclease [Bacteroidota bacterium]
MMDRSLRNILIVDIETVALEKDYARIPDGLKKHWERKAGFIRNEEELTPDELFSERAGIYAEFGKVIVIAFGFFHEEDGKVTFRAKSLAADNEKELLNDFKKVLLKFDQQELKLCAHNGKEFDFPYLCRRMLINDIRLPDVLDTGGKKPWEVNHVDTLEMWKFGDRKNYTSLDLLTTIFDIPSNKTDMDGSMVNEVYYNEDNGLKRIEQYCLGDVIATAQLYLRLNSLPTIANENITVVS